MATAELQEPPLDQEPAADPLQGFEALLDRIDGANPEERAKLVEQVANQLRAAVTPLCNSSSERRLALVKRAVDSTAAVQPGVRDVRGFARIYAAFVHRSTNAPTRAVAVLHRWFDEHPNHVDSANALEQLVRGHLENRDPEAARIVLDAHGAAAVRSVVDQSLLGLLRSEVLRTLGQTEAALVAVDQALVEVNRAIKDEGTDAAVANTLRGDRRWLMRDQGELFMASGKNAAAEAVFAELIQDWEKAGSAALAGEMRVCHANAAYVLERLDSEYPRQAYDEISTALEGPLPRSIRASGYLDALRIGFAEHARGLEHQNQDLVQVAAARIQTHLKAVRDINFRPQDLALRAVFEHRHARLLPDEAASKDEQGAHRQECAVALQDAARALLQHWRQSPPESAGRGFLERIDPRMIVAELLWTHLVGVDERVEDPEALIEDLCRVGAASRLGAGVGVTAEHGEQLASLAEIRSGLVGPKAGTLVFFPDYFGIHVIAIDAKEVRWWSLPKTFAELNRRNSSTNQTVFSHPEVLRKWTPKQLDTVASRLADDFDALVPASARESLRGWDSLTIIGGGFVGRFPFEAVPEPGGGLLGERVAISYLPSLQYGVVRSRAQRDLPRRAQALAFTVPTREQEAADGSTGLWLSDDELQRMRDRLSGLGEDVVHASDDVTSTMLRESLAQPLGLVHWVAHAGRGPNEPAATLQLKDGSMGSEALDGVSFAGVAILSACSAGSGAWALGEGELTTTLGGALLRGGARSVITPITEIPVEDHLLFVDHVLEALRDGASPAAACRDARRTRAAAKPKDRVGRLTRAFVQVHGLAQRPLWPKAR